MGISVCFSGAVSGKSLARHTAMEIGCVLLCVLSYSVAKQRPATLKSAEERKHVASHIKGESYAYRVYPPPLRNFWAVHGAVDSRCAAIRFYVLRSPLSAASFLLGAGLSCSRKITEHTRRTSLTVRGPRSCQKISKVVASDKPYMYSARG